MRFVTFETDTGKMARIHVDRIEVVEPANTAGCTYIKLASGNKVTVKATADDVLKAIERAGER